MPHSGIRGSTAIQRLTAAYRSRSRPSSTPGAKASTTCRYYLDGDHAGRVGRRGDTRSLAPLCSFQGPRRGVRLRRGRGRPGEPEHGRAGRRRSLKTRQHASPAGIHAGGAVGRPPKLPRLGRHSRGRRCPPPAAPEKVLPRKEVIQPHLPVRLPCYDFTPVTGPTFDGSLPCGLGHRLRALPIPVV